MNIQIIYSKFLLCGTIQKLKEKSTVYRLWKGLNIWYGKEWNVNICMWINIQTNTMFYFSSKEHYAYIYSLPNYVY